MEMERRTISDDAIEMNKIMNNNIPIFSRTMSSRAFEFDSPRAAVAPSTRMLLLRNKRKFVSEQSTNNAVFGSLSSPSPATRTTRLALQKPLVPPVVASSNNDDDDSDEGDDNDDVEEEYGIVLGPRVKSAASSASKRDKEQWMSKKNSNGYVYEQKRKKKIHADSYF